MLDDLDKLFDTNQVTTSYVPPTKDPKRYIFKRIEGTNDLLLRIDNSSLERFVTCPRSAEYHLIEGREMPSSPAPAFGSRIHECLEYTYGHAFDEKTWRHCLRILETRYLEAPFPEDEWRTFDLAVDLMSRYFNKYQLDLHTNKPLSLERSFSLPLCTFQVNATLKVTGEKLLGEVGNQQLVYVNKVHVYWSGKIDMLMENRANGIITVWDTKTTSMMGPSFWDDFKISNQIIGYVWAAKQLFNLDKYPPALINALGIRKPTKFGKQIELDRMPLVYDEYLVNEWIQDVQYLVLDFIAHLKQGYFPKATKWCLGKYSKCQYHSVCCATSKEARLTELSYMHDVTWTPFLKPVPIEEHATSAPDRNPTISQFLGGTTTTPTTNGPAIQQVCGDAGQTSPSDVGSANSHQNASTPRIARRVGRGWGTGRPAKKARYLQPNPGRLGTGRNYFGRRGTWRSQVLYPLHSKHP